MFKFFSDMGSAEMAAWVQAVGSLAAVFFAIRIPLRIHREQEQTRKAVELAERKARISEAEARTRSYALKLMGPVQTLLQTVAEVGFEYRDEEADDVVAMANRLVVPKEIDDLKLALHEMGDPGTTLQTALVAVDEVKRALTTESILAQYGDWPELQGEPDPRTGDHFRTAQRLLDTSLEQMRRLFEPV